MRAPFSPDHWCPPPIGFLKLNFDGASKGNPGPVGFGGVFRNNMGEIVCLYYGNIKHDSNNATELSGLLHGLIISRQ
jgi:ribonuclease HI